MQQCRWVWFSGECRHVSPELLRATHFLLSSTNIRDRDWPYFFFCSGLLIIWQGELVHTSSWRWTLWPPEERPHYSSCVSWFNVIEIQSDTWNDVVFICHLNRKCIWFQLLSVELWNVFLDVHCVLLYSSAWLLISICWDLDADLQYGMFLSPPSFLLA